MTMPGTHMPKEEAQAALAAALPRGRPQPELWDIWLWSGADVDTLADNSRKTALMIAAQTGDLETIQYLLSRGANINLQHETTGKTALMIAATVGKEDHCRVIEYLLAQGADSFLADQAGLTVLDHAKTPAALASVRQGYATQRQNYISQNRDDLLAATPYSQKRTQAQKYKFKP